MNVNSPLIQSDTFTLTDRQHKLERELWWRLISCCLFLTRTMRWIWFTKTRSGCGSVCVLWKTLVCPGAGYICVILYYFSACLLHENIASCGRYRQESVHSMQSLVVWGEKLFSALLDATRVLHEPSSTIYLPSFPDTAKLGRFERYSCIILA